MKGELPNIAELFEDPAAIEKMKVPEVDESAPIQYHWEKVAKRMLTHLMKNEKAGIFNEPVDPIKYNIPDYNVIIKEPMDFSTVKEKLAAHRYSNMQHFLNDIELIFSNCILYNGQESPVVAHWCRPVEEEFHKLCEQLNVGFYITEAEQ